MVCQTSKHVGEGSVHFQLQLNTKRALSLPKDKKPEGLRHANVGAVPKIPFANMYHFHSLV